MIRDETKVIANSVVGMRLDVARQALAQNQLACRVIMQDGMQLEGSSDMRPNRVNVEIIDGKVVAAHVG